MSNLLEDKEHFEAPDFEDHFCEVEGCDEFSEHEFMGHWFCDSCFNEVLENPRGGFAMGVLGRIR